MTKFSVKKTEVSADFRGKISQNFVETVQTPGSEAESAKKKKKKKKKKSKKKGKRNCDREYI